MGQGVKKYANAFTAEQITLDLEFYCNECDSVTQSLLLSLQIKTIHIDKTKSISEIPKGLSLSSLMKASQRLRDMSLVQAGYLLCKNGQLLVNEQQVFADCTFVVKYDQQQHLFVILIKQNQSLKQSTRESEFIF